MDQRLAVLLVLRLRHPHLLEGAQARQNRPADPHAEPALDRVGRARDLHLARRRERDLRGRVRRQVPLEPLPEPWQQGGSPGEDDVGVEVALEVGVARGDRGADGVGQREDRRRRGRCCCCGSRSVRSRRRCSRSCRRSSSSSSSCSRRPARRTRSERRDLHAVPLEPALRVEQQLGDAESVGADLELGAVGQLVGHRRHRRVGVDVKGRLGGGAAEGLLGVGGEGKAVELAEGARGLGLAEARDFELARGGLGPLEGEARGDFVGSSGLLLEHREHRARQGRAGHGGAGDRFREEVALVDGGDCC